MAIFIGKDGRVFSREKQMTRGVSLIQSGTPRRWLHYTHASSTTEAQRSPKPTIGVRFPGRVPIGAWRNGRRACLRSTRGIPRGFESRRPDHDDRNRHKAVFYFGASAHSKARTRKEKNFGAHVPPNRISRIALVSAHFPGIAAQQIPFVIIADVMGVYAIPLWSW